MGGFKKGYIRGNIVKRRKRIDGAIAYKASVADATRIAYVNAPRALASIDTLYNASLKADRAYSVLWGDNTGTVIYAENFEAVKRFIHKYWFSVELTKANTTHKDFHPELKGTTIYAGYFVTGGLQVHVTVCDVTDGFWPNVYGIPNSVAIRNMIKGYVNNTDWM